MACTPEDIAAVYRARYTGFGRALAHMLGDSDAAHDAVQEGFARALAARRRYRGGSLEAWIWRIVERTAFEQRRRTRRMPPAASAEHAPKPLAPALTEALRSLPERQRLMVFLRYYADLTQPQIAQACDVQVGTVAATLAHARAALARALDADEVTT
jgi:RNA polymerase sigma factor (sigma-70 family)